MPGTQNNFWAQMKTQANVIDDPSAGGGQAVAVPETPEEAQAMGMTPDEFTQAHQALGDGILAPISPDRKLQDLAQTYDMKQRALLNQQKSGLGQIEQLISDYKNQGLEYDPRYLASFADIIDPEQNWTGRAVAPTGRAQAKQEKLISLQEGLQQRKEALTKNEADALKAQIEAYKALKGKEKDPLLEELRRSQIRANNVAAGLKADPEPKDFQAQAATYGKRAEQAEAIFQQLESEGYNRGTRAESLKTLLPGELQGGNLKRQEQAERNFINAILRRESGATITPSEFDSAAEQYFKRPGDTPEVVAQKRQNRLQAIEGMKVTAGHAWSKIGTPKTQAAPNMPKVGSVVNGYEFLGGNPADRNSWRKK